MRWEGSRKEKGDCCCEVAPHILSSRFYPLSYWFWKKKPRLSLEWFLWALQLAWASDGSNGCIWVGLGGVHWCDVKGQTVSEESTSGSSGLRRFVGKESKRVQEKWCEMCRVSCGVHVLYFQYEENTDVKGQVYKKNKKKTSRATLFSLWSIWKWLVIVSGVTSWSKLSFYSDQTELLFIFPFVCMLNSKMIHSRALKHIDVLYRTSLELY